MISFIKDGNTFVGLYTSKAEAQKSVTVLGSGQIVDNATIVRTYLSDFQAALEAYWRDEDVQINIGAIPQSSPLYRYVQPT